MEGDDFEDDDGDRLTALAETAALTDHFGARQSDDSDAESAGDRGPASPVDESHAGNGHGHEAAKAGTRDAPTVAPRWSWPWIRDSLKSRRFVGTLAYALSFWLLGLVIASLGPTLLFLSEQTEASLDLLGFIFPARSFAYLLGSAFSGPLYDRIDGNRLLAACLFATTAGTAAIPFCRTVWLLSLCVAMQGMAMGFLDTGGNVMLVWLHGGDRVAPYMQLIHFAFGVGAFVSPMVVELSVQLTGSVKWSFVIMAGCFLPIAALVFLTHSPKATDHGSHASSRKRTRREWALILLGSLMLALYVGAEVSMGGYVYAYFVKLLGHSEREGNFLTSAFWGCIALGRAIAIPISVVLSSKNMLLANMAVSALSVTAIFMFPVEAVIWAGTVLFGLGMASTYPTVLTLVETYVNLSGKITSVLVVGGALGEMAVPLVLVLLFRANGDENLGLLFPVLSFVCVANIVVLVAFILIGRPILKNRQADGFGRSSPTYLELSPMDAADELPLRDANAASELGTTEDADDPDS